MTTDIPNVLAERYASAAMKNLWSATGKVIMEREFWIAVMKAQRELGMEISAADVEASEKAKGVVDLESIRRREEVTKHGSKSSRTRPVTNMPTRG